MWRGRWKAGSICARLSSPSGSLDNCSPLDLPEHGDVIRVVLQQVKWSNQGMVGNQDISWETVA